MDACLHCHFLALTDAKKSENAKKYQMLKGQKCLLALNNRIWDFLANGNFSNWDFLALVGAKMCKKTNF